MMLPNCSAVLKRPSAVTVAVNGVPSGEGSEPILPAANCTFCARTAVSASLADRPKARSLSGLSQMPMAYSPPNSWVLPTPGRRATWSSTRAAIRSASAFLSYAGLVERSAVTIRKPELALATTTPCCTTSDGSRGVASATLFCTCTWAISGSVPGLKVSVIEAPPLALDEELKYSRLSMPVSCCSITWVTAPSVVSALAPGYAALTVTCGGAMLGYDSTPRPRMARMPDITIRIAITQANTGWLMKKRDMTGQPFAGAGTAAGWLGAWPVAGIGAALAG